MNVKLLLVGGILLFSLSASAQRVHVNPYINLHEDSVMKKAIVNALEGLLEQKEKPNKDNTFFLKDDLLEASILIDEVKRLERSAAMKDTAFYQCQLNNIIPNPNKQYLVQFSYMGVRDNVPYLRASFNFIAKEKDDRIYFASPLKQNTKNWKVQKIGSVTFRYKSKLNIAQANEYVKTIAYYDKKLKATTPEVRIIYNCDHFAEALQVMGVNYKQDYNSYASYALSSVENGQTLMVAGDPEEGKIAYDPHDLWHARLKKVMAPSVINKAVDEGCAFLYGGSWGLSWQDIHKSFMDKLGNDPKSNWLDLYEEMRDHGDDKMKPLLANYTINAFIVRQLEKDKGFDAVKELLSCGPYEKGNEKYFAVLEKLTGISKANFNERVWALVRNSKM